MKRWPRTRPVNGMRTSVVPAASVRCHVIGLCDAAAVDLRADASSRRELDVDELLAGDDVARDGRDGELRHARQNRERQRAPRCSAGTASVSFSFACAPTKIVLATRGAELQAHGRRLPRGQAAEIAVEHGHADATRTAARPRDSLADRVQRDRDQHMNPSGARADPCSGRRWSVGPDPRAVPGRFDADTVVARSGKPAGGVTPVAPAPPPRASATRAAAR